MTWLAVIFAAAAIAIIWRYAYRYRQEREAVRQRIRNLPFSGHGVGHRYRAHQQDNSKQTDPF